MAAHRNRPNIVLIITDQQRYDTIASLGFPFAETPHLDRLVAQGVAFTDCHATAPSCAPSRASLFTGYYPHTTGIFKNADTWRRSWLEKLSESGYHCVNIGKMHSFPYETPMGFQERYVVENKDRHLEGRYYFDEWDKALAARKLRKPGRLTYRHLPDYRERMGAVEWALPRDMHPDAFVGDVARWWLDRKPRTEPLFLQIGFPGPHPPYDPPRSYIEPYVNRNLPIQGVGQEELDAQPPAFHALGAHNVAVDHDAVVHDLDPSSEQLKRLRAHYLGNVTLIDEKIGQVLDKLRDRGYLEDAVVIFTSDHGDCLGDHGHIQKWTMYDAVTRVPLVVFSPGRFQGGARIEPLYQVMDVGPTILELAGLPVPDSMEAISLLPALRGEPVSGREYVFAEHARDAILQGTEFMTMVRSKTWKLVHFLDEPHGQLFNLVDDPEERHDLWNVADHEQKKRELLDVLREWLIRSHHRTGDWSRAFR